MQYIELGSSHRESCLLIDVMLRLGITTIHGGGGALGPRPRLLKAFSLTLSSFSPQQRRAGMPRLNLLQEREGSATRRGCNKA